MNGEIRMQKAFDYNQHFDDALRKIKSIRDPHAKLIERSDLGWNKVQQQRFTNIGGNDFDRYVEVVNAARTYTINAVLTIIMQLIREKATYCKGVKTERKEDGRSKIYLAFKDTRDNCLIIIKDVEPDVGWVNTFNTPDGIEELMQKTSSRTFKNVYLLHDYAYLQVIGHNEDETDPSRGSNAYSLRWLFDTYFGIGEYDLFKTKLESYRKSVDNYLGYTITRSLNTSALINFQKITGHSLESFDYKKILKKVVYDHHNKPHWLNGLIEYQKLEDQFFAQNTYMVLLGNHPFSESLITAEWLLDSMKKAHAVDLTVIGMGYFKAIEQLLFDLVKLYDPLFSRDATLGDYATFYKGKCKGRCDTFLRNDIHLSTRRFLYEAIYEYARLRNGYFHKDNIHDWDSIEEVRTTTLLLIFLLLGCQNLTNDNLIELGLPDISTYNDFSKLCEYINFHSGSLFCLEVKDESILWVVAIDSNSIRHKVDGNAAYFKFLGTEQYIIITENKLPQRLWSGKLNIPQTKEVKFEPIKDQLIFEYGHFVGPSIVAEDGFTY